MIICFNKKEYVRTKSLLVEASKSNLGWTVAHFLVHQVALSHNDIDTLLLFLYLTFYFIDNNPQKSQLEQAPSPYTMVTTYVVVSIAFDYISIMYNISDLLVWAR
jgi:hypothetical protein